MILETPYPENCTLEIDGDVASVAFRIDGAFPYFEGHFPGNPIVPAVTQVGWIVSAIEGWRGAPLEGYRLSRFKFVSPLRPEVLVEITLERAGDRYAIRVIADGALCCSGNVTVVL